LGVVAAEVVAHFVGYVVDVEGVSFGCVAACGTCGFTAAAGCTKVSNTATIGLGDDVTVVVVGTADNTIRIGSIFDQ
jgi:hypothetical protein